MTRPCEGCIRHRVKAAVAAGATETGFRERLEVCVPFGGGPAATFAGSSLEFLRTLMPA